MRIVAFAPNSWQSQWVNRQQLLSRLGARHPVVYSNGAWSVWDRHSPQWRAAPWRGLVVPSDNVLVEVAPRGLLRWSRWPAFDQRMLRAHASHLRRVLRHDELPLVAMIFHPAHAPYARYLGAQVVAYHAYDLFEASPDWNDRLAAMELQLLRQADVVSTVSVGTRARLAEKVQRDIHVLPNGVDLQAFVRASNEAIPADLATIPRPRLGYVGSLHPQVDFKLVAEMAHARADWHFVMVGAQSPSADARAEQEIAACRKLPNVHFLGTKSVHHVPAYTAHMDANLMLYRLDPNSWVHVGYPLKLHEYLAVGRPVVSADLAAVRPFSSVVRIACGLPDWLQAIDDALCNGGHSSPSERRAVAADNTWDVRVQVLEGWLLQALGHLQTTCLGRS
jgi:glycosyltransferase involved in cell wall biosynthesis